ncbi:MAG: hypothetical protein RTV41_11205 [Candidatus Thorarchaeota archaeon]
MYKHYEASEDVFVDREEYIEWQKSQEILSGIKINEYQVKEIRKLIDGGKWIMQEVEIVNPSIS